MENNNTAQTILNVAQDIVRNRGYSAFSYADIAKQVGIRKASIHYHFPGKEDLVKKLVEQYREGMAKACDRIARSNAKPQDQLLAFANLYRNGLAEHKICLCAMLAADFAVLPDSIQAEIRVFFQDTATWLASLLQTGCDAKVWDCSTTVEQDAQGLIAMLQGAQLLSRSAINGDAIFEQMVYPLLQAKFAQV
ncbi:MAG: TetR/AcrR family transcriptional regulator [Spirulina sp. SIO3F2]|nr:TetR/AcrR family transcriptional regulator [Spirulina sp. SIO3F2]